MSTPTPSMRFHEFQPPPTLDQLRLMQYHPVMAAKEEMRQWFYDRYETAVGAWFYDTKLNDLQRIAAPVDVRQALAEHFPESSPEQIDDLAKDLDIEGAWIDPSSEKPVGTEPADPLLS